MKKRWVSRLNALLTVCLVLLTGAAGAQELTKITFPYGPHGLNSLPWVIAKEARIFEKNGLDVDMVYVGASAVIVQSMLSGSANVAGFGGPAVVTNVLRGGDIIQVAAMAPTSPSRCSYARISASSEPFRARRSASRASVP